MDYLKDNLTNWLQLLFIATGGLYALYLLRQSVREKRNKMILDILDRFFGDLEIKKILYSVDQGLDTNEIKFGGKLEQQADKTIKYLDYIGRLIKQGELKRKDIGTFKYEIKRILNSSPVQEYIIWLKNIGVSLEHLNQLDYIKQMKTTPNLRRTIR